MELERISKGYVEDKEYILYLERDMVKTRERLLRNRNGSGKDKNLIW